MAELSIEVERIVREALAALRRPIVSGPDGERGKEGEKPEARAAAEEKKPKSAERADGELAISRRLVSLADLPEPLAGVRRIVVPQRAVVTPSVRDELQRRNIALAYGEPHTAEATGRTKVLVLAMGPKIDPALLAKSLEDEGHTVTSDRMDCLLAATDRLANELSTGPTLAVLLTKHTAAAICLGNRRPGVRAILGIRPETVADDAASVGANLLVMDPSAQGFFPTRQTAIQFLRNGPRACPEVFQEKLR